MRKAAVLFGFGYAALAAWASLTQWVNALDARLLLPLLPVLVYLAVAVVYRNAPA